MKCVISKEALLNGLQAVQNIVGGRTTLPILNNALLKAENGKLLIAATDLDVGIRSLVGATIEKTGSTTLPAKRLFTIVRELPSDEITIEVDGKNYTSIRSGSAFFKIVGLSEDDYPAFPKTENAKSYKLKQSDLKDMLKRTAYAMSTDESRYVLNGVLLSFKENKLTMVATDGRRMALIEQDLEIPQSQETEIILPTKAVNELQRILGGDEEVTISISENQIVFDIGHIVLYSKLIDGKYPNYRQVIPAEAKERAIIERELLLSAVHRVSLLANDRSTSIKLAFGKNTLDVMANTPEVGEAKETLTVNYKGKEFTIAFNPYFLMEPLKNIDAEEIFLDFIDELSPGVLKYNKPFLYVIMPMRTA
jgi:DNA polymerase III subunit beta